MDITGGWYKVKVDLEALLDLLFNLSPEQHYEFDSLVALDDMNALGYLRNFPHLGCLACSIDKSSLTSFSKGGAVLDPAFADSRLDYALLPAACYKIYLDRRGQHLDTAEIVGCIAKCFRHEDKPIDAFRAVNFTMKEFVCVGGNDDVSQHLGDGQERIKLLLDMLEIDFSLELASDPFFDVTSSTATLAKLMPTKQEIIYGGHAIASLNFHRNYFGEKFDIQCRGEFANTGCVAFGLERWISMFKEIYPSARAALATLDHVTAAITQHRTASLSSYGGG